MRNSLAKRLILETKVNYLCSNQYFTNQPRTLFNILLKPEEDKPNATLNKETLDYIKDYQEIVDYQLSKYGWISGSFRGKSFGYFSYPVKDFEEITDPDFQKYRTVKELKTYLSLNVARNRGGFDFSKFRLLTLSYFEDTHKNTQSLEELAQGFKASKDKENLQAPQIIAAYFLTEFETKNLAKPIPKEIRIDMNKKWVDLENRHLRFLESNETQHLEVMEQIRATDSNT